MQRQLSAKYPEDLKKLGVKFLGGYVETAKDFVCEIFLSLLAERTGSGMDGWLLAYLVSNMISQLSAGVPFDLFSLCHKHFLIDSCFYCHQRTCKHPLTVLLVSLI